jgi:hypothetical protein
MRSDSCLEILKRTGNSKIPKKKDEGISELRFIPGMAMPLRFSKAG